MAELEFSLHGKQAEVYNCLARFVVCAAGRQSGKTTLAIAKTIAQSLSTVSVGGKKVDETHEVGYIFPTFEAGKKIVWPRMKAALRPLGDMVQIYENTGLVVFPNGVRWRLWGADVPDNIRGPTFRYVVLDEFKDMPGFLFDEIVRPALSVTAGGALFIGTPPKSADHFYELFQYASGGTDPDFAAFTFTSAENPAISAAEIVSMRRKMSSEIAERELGAKWLTGRGNIFDRDWFPIDEREPEEGEWYIAYDPAGFKKIKGKPNEIEKRDEHAIAIVKDHPKGWWVKEIKHGRWAPREAALNILVALRACGIHKIGIEKGNFLGAIEGYLTELAAEYGRRVEIVELTHGNNQKEDRIQWALQGRAEKREIVLNKGPWNEPFLGQAAAFPSRSDSVRDDMLDALAYIDQLVPVQALKPAADYELPQDYEPLDTLVGYKKLFAAGPGRLLLPNLR